MLRGLKAIALLDDIGFPLAFNILHELKNRVGNMPLIVKVGFPEFIECLSQGRLCGGVLYNVKGAPDIETANKCMEKVRAYRCNDF